MKEKPRIEVEYEESGMDHKGLMAFGVFVFLFLAGLALIIWVVEYWRHHS